MFFHIGPHFRRKSKGELYHSKDAVSKFFNQLFLKRKEKVTIERKLKKKEKNEYFENYFDDKNVWVFFFFAKNYKYMFDLVNE